jgi:hypothetical protein
VNGELKLSEIKAITVKLKIGSKWWGSFLI